MKKTTILMALFVLLIMSLSVSAETISSNRAKLDGSSYLVYKTYTSSQLSTTQSSLNMYVVNNIRGFQTQGYVIMQFVDTRDRLAISWNGATVLEDTPEYIYFIAMSRQISMESGRPAVSSVPMSVIMYKNSNYVYIYTPTMILGTTYEVA